MDDRRLISWLEDHPVLPDRDRIGVFNAWPDIDLPGLAPERIRAVQPFAPHFEALCTRGIKTAKIVNYRYTSVVLRVPRQKDRALCYLRDAITRTPAGGSIIVDGQKSDGIESILKLCRDRYDVRDTVSKAHGKVFRIRKKKYEDDVMASLDLPKAEPQLKPSGFYTAPGVFSADGPDPGSVCLADMLPEMTGRVADLGAGWGYLSHRILEKSSPEALHLVEADWPSIACAEKNVASAAARFHWTDATAWTPDAPLDHVVTNPPFHQARKAEPRLGQAFIRSAAAMLRPSGTLWLVANRHLPYEGVLEDTFRDIAELDGPPAFKLIRARKPKRPFGRG